MDGFRRMLWVGRQHSADHIPVSALQLVTRGGLGPRVELRRTGLQIPSGCVTNPVRLRVRCAPVKLAACFG